MRLNSRNGLWAQNLGDSGPFATLSWKLKNDTGCSGLVHWDDPEGWYGEGGGRGSSGWGTRVHPWRIHVDV